MALYSTHFIQSIKKTSVASLKYVIDASTIIEKVLWVILLLTGTCYTILILHKQFTSWENDSIVSLHKWIDLSEIDFPAITICHQGNTRNFPMERLMSGIKEGDVRIRQLRNVFLQSALDFGRKIDIDLDTDSKKTTSADSKYLQYEYEHGCLLKNLDWCKSFEALFSFMMSLNMTAKEFYVKIYEDLTAQSDIQKTLQSIKTNIESSPYHYGNISNYLGEDDINWIFLNHMDALFNQASDKKLQFPINLGRSLTEMKKSGHDHMIRKVFEFFSHPKLNITLSFLSHLYTLTDFGQFGSKSMFEELDFDTDFKSCFEIMYQDYYENKTIFEVAIENEVSQNPSFMMPSPCSSSSNLNCAKYCEWHTEVLLKELLKKEFLALMKLSVPQASLKQAPLNKIERKISEEILGKDNVNEVKFPFLGLAPVIFCKMKSSQKWQGIDAQMYPKICDDFQKSFSDEGVCLTKNFNINDLFYLNSEYGEVFNLRKSKIVKAEGDRFEAKATFVLYTNSININWRAFSKNANILKDLKNEEDWEIEDLSNIHLKIHSTSNIAMLAKDPKQRKRLDSLKLKAGNEYTIRIKPLKQDVTENFERLDKTKRNCLLETEVPKGCQLKLYSLSNCHYECKTNYAMSLCQCCAWDFPLCYNKSSECDVFGRTCFHNVMNRIMLDLDKKCPQCKPSCKKIEYESKILSMKPLIQESDGWYTKSEYFSEYYGGCSRRDFCDFILDRNNTIEPLSWYEIIYNESPTLKDDKSKNGVRMMKDMIILNVEFENPHVETVILDTRYSLTDKIAGLGGILGLFGQMTGASFITLLHLLILVFHGCRCKKNVDL